MSLESRQNTEEIIYQPQISSHIEESLIYIDNSRDTFHESLSTVLTASSNILNECVQNPSMFIETFKKIIDISEGVFILQNGEPTKEGLNNWSPIHSVVEAHTEIISDIKNIINKYGDYGIQHVIYSIYAYKFNKNLIAQDYLQNNVFDNSDFSESNNIEFSHDKISKMTSAFIDFFKDYQLTK